MIVVRPAMKPAQRFDDTARGDRVQSGGRFVQDEDRRVTQHGPRDGEALQLAAGQPCGVGVDPGVVPLGQRGDELVRVGRPGRFLDGVVARAG